MLDYHPSAPEVPLNELARAHSVIVSFPKAGRTWLRLMIGMYLADTRGLVDAPLLELDGLSDIDPTIPRIVVTHEQDLLCSRPEDLLTDKTVYAGKRILLLVRDPRDVMVSAFFQKTRRQGIAVPDLSRFVRGAAGGIATFVAWHNLWAASDQSLCMSIASYEGLSVRPVETLTVVLRFLLCERIVGPTVVRAVERAQFDRMREMEERGSLRSERLSPGKVLDEESRKVRRGVVGGFIDYLSEGDQTYIEQRVADGLYADLFPAICGVRF